ncbi:MAG: hypothetical protein FWE47_01520 [Oscillospiraceae bacterium]|nr:hypothetical protein [Oscillospiraceae bacterium]
MASREIIITYNESNEKRLLRFLEKNGYQVQDYNQIAYRQKIISKKLFEDLDSIPEYQSFVISETKKYYDKVSMLSDNKNDDNNIYSSRALVNIVEIILREKLGDEKYNEIIDSIVCRDKAEFDFSRKLIKTIKRTEEFMKAVAEKNNRKFYPLTEKQLKICAKSIEDMRGIAILTHNHVSMDEIIQLSEVLLSVSAETYKPLEYAQKTANETVRYRFDEAEPTGFVTIAENNYAQYLAVHINAIRKNPLEIKILSYMENFVNNHEHHIFYKEGVNLYDKSNFHHRVGKYYAFLKDAFKSDDINSNEINRIFRTVIGKAKQTMRAYTKYMKSTDSFKNGIHHKEKVSNLVLDIFYKAVLNNLIGLEGHNSVLQGCCCLELRDICDATCLEDENITFADATAAFGSDNVTEDFPVFRLFESKPESIKNILDELKKGDKANTHGMINFDYKSNKKKGISEKVVLGLKK